MEYQIIATLGPASDQPALWRELIAAGATAFRLNTSHLNIEQLQQWLDRLAQAGLGDFPLVLDLQGSKWRLGELAPLELAVGQVVELVLAERVADANRLPVPHADFFRAAGQSSAEIMLNDARVVLQCLEGGPDWLRVRVTQAGPVSARKGITYANSSYRQEGLTGRDAAVVSLAQDLRQAQFAVSYVRDAAEMGHYRQQTVGHRLIAKLERRSAMLAAKEMAGECDELWVCRGDLGAEVGLVDMARLVAGLTAAVRTLPVPVILAGQVLEHTTHHPQPTRSEVCHLHDSLQAGYAGLVLSDETAVGLDPLASCRAAALFRSG